MNKGIVSVLAIVIGAIVLVGGIGGYVYFKHQTKPVACTTDAKQCLDGSYVSRIGPNCEFAECSTVTSTSASTSTAYTDSTKPFIKVISPISGETLQEGANYKIKWNASNLPVNATISISLLRSDLEPNSPLNVYITSLPGTQREYIWEVSHWGFVHKNSPSPLAKIFGIKTTDAAEKLSYKIAVSAGWEATPTKRESVIGYSGKFYINQ